MNEVKYVTGTPTIGNDASLGVVHLRVSNLEDQVLFYTKALKLTVLEQTSKHAILGDLSNKPLLQLNKEDNLKRYGTTSGLYHFALLYPNEVEFAKAVAWLMTIKYPNSPTDHGFSKTTYLKDLEGNDIELYIRTVDRAKYINVYGQNKIKYLDGRITDGRDHLDLDELFNNLTTEDKIDTPLNNMEMGHVHLYGYNLDDMQKFYVNVIGYAEGIYMPYFAMSDVGLTHEKNHIIAFNAWRRTNKSAPSDALGLDYYTITFTNKDSYNELINRIKTNNINIQTNELGELFILDPSEIKIKIELK